MIDQSHKTVVVGFMQFAVVCFIYPHHARRQFHASVPLSPSSPWASSVSCISSIGIVTVITTFVHRHCDPHRHFQAYISSSSPLSHSYVRVGMASSMATPHVSTFASTPVSSHSCFSVSIAVATVIFVHQHYDWCHPHHHIHASIPASSSQLPLSYICVGIVVVIVSSMHMCPYRQHH